jgi:hypothetical protein
MNDILKMIVAAIFVILCQMPYVSAKSTEDSPAVQTLKTCKDARTYEGAMLKLAKPFLKKTPMGFLTDKIESIRICPIDKNGKEDVAVLTTKIEKMLKHYSNVNEINDDSYHMLIYIDEVKGNSFSEIILYTTSSEKSVMVFNGDFTIESLKKVGEISDQQRQERKKTGTKHESIISKR